MARKYLSRVYCTQCCVPYRSIALTLRSSRYILISKREKVKSGYYISLLVELKAFFVTILKILYLFCRSKKTSS